MKEKEWPQYFRKEDIAAVCVGICFLVKVLSAVGVAVLTLVVASMEHSIYLKNHPVIPEFYTSEEKNKFAEGFPHRVAAGIGMILVGLLIGMNGDEFSLREGMREDPIGGLLCAMAALILGTKRDKM